MALPMHPSGSYTPTHKLCTPWAPWSFDFPSRTVEWSETEATSATVHRLAGHLVWVNALCSRRWGNSLQHSRGAAGCGSGCRRPWTLWNLWDGTWSGNETLSSTAIQNGWRREKENQQILGSYIKDLNLHPLYLWHTYRPYCWLRDWMMKYSLPPSAP